LELGLEEPSGIGLPGIKDFRERFDNGAKTDALVVVRRLIHRGTQKATCLVAFTGFYVNFSLKDSMR